MQSQKVEGVGSIYGGEYDRIEIEGIGNSKGDIKANDLLIEGVFKTKGHINAERIYCEGMADFSESIRAKTIFIDGVMKLSKGAKLEAEDIKCEGCLIVKSELSAERLNVDGCIKAEEIYGEDINIISKRGIGGKVGLLLFGIGDVVRGSSEVDLIEATNVTLRNVRVREVNGFNITIGENCIIDHVDCTGTLRVHQTARVNKITGVSEKSTQE